MILLTYIWKNIGMAISTIYQYWKPRKKKFDIFITWNDDCDDNDAYDKNDNVNMMIVMVGLMMIVMMIMMVGVIMMTIMLKYDDSHDDVWW